MYNIGNRVLTYFGKSKVLFSASRIHNIFVPMAITVLWVIGLVLSVMDIQVFNVDKKFDTICVVYLIFLLETTIHFFDIAARNSKTDFSAKIVLLFSFVIFNIVIAIVVSLFYIRFKNPYLLYLSVIVVSFVKFIDVRLQNSETAYFNSPKDLRGNNFSAKMLDINE